ncbi:MAG TPA: cytochrome c biogenesis protein CcdA [Chlamydiales bacterium]|nr:cytochrome c biogenesis protein CcdA [Chlamydiales bacterium]
MTHANDGIKSGACINRASILGIMSANLINTAKRFISLWRLVVVFFAFSSLAFSILHTENALPLLPNSISSPQISVEAFSENESIQPGSTFLVATRFLIPPDWHLYWVNPASTGVAPQINWKLPAGWTASDMRFPVPSRIELLGTVIYGYSNECILLQAITAPMSLMMNDIYTLEADVAYVACGTSCIPGKATVTVSVKAAPNNVEDAATRPLFQKARSLIAKTIQARVVAKNGGIEIQIPSINVPNAPLNTSDIEGVLFFPERQGVFPASFIPEWKLSDNGRKLFVTLPTKDTKDALGIVQVQFKKNAGAKDLAVQIRPNGFSKKGSLEAVKNWYHSEIVSIQGIFTYEFLLILVSAFFGGLLLNVMPCVLPVVSLKILHFMKLAAKEKKEDGKVSRSTTFKHGFAFSAGVVVCFWVLAGAIFALQAFGKTVGWGFQLQEPFFVAALIVILFVLSLSLFGLFEFGTKISSIAAELDEVAKAGSPMEQEHFSATSSFFSGMLATFVASPCTGPLLGSAIGFAATLSPTYAFFVFTTLGVGMASPYFLISLFPGLLQIVPKPGRWMVTFKQLMGFLLLATILWLIWVLNAETQDLSMLSLLSAFFMITFGFWIYGTWGGFERKNAVRGIAKLFAFVVVVSGIAFFMNDVGQARGKPARKTEESHVKDLPPGTAWESFSIDRFHELRQKGQPVYIEFTAKWCLICQTNAVVLETRSVKEAFIKYGVVKMEADWTQRDEVITQFIRGLGRNGVPIHALYPRGDAAQPEMLPELLTQESIIEALKQSQQNVH